MIRPLPVSLRELFSVFLGFLLLALLALGVNPLRGQIVGPFDLLVSQQGWGNRMTSDQVRNMERSDVLDYYLPRWIEARHEIREGRLPLWNPLPAGGEPGILNLAAGELTPAFLLFAMSPSAPLGLLAATLFNLAFGATGVYAFMRRHGSGLPALFAAVTVMLCGFNAAWLYWPHVSTVVWTGWLLWGIDRAMLRHARYAVATFSLPLVGLLLGGFPFVSLLGMGAGLLYVICALLVEPERRHGLSAKRLLWGTLLAVGIALPGVLGFAEWLVDFDLSLRSTGSMLSYKDIRLLLPHAARRHLAVEWNMFAGTVAFVLVAIASVATAVSLFARRRPALIMVFSLALLACAGVLTFELLPRPLLAWIPGLANNQWSRAICILDIAIALTAGSLLQRAEVRFRREVFVAATLGLTLVQTVDLARHFRLFNGPVDAATFYPKVPLIERIATTTNTFQSVVADDSFLLSGSLGAYGIPEWFGHGFRTESLKRVLEKLAEGSLKTATSGRINANALQLNSPLMSALGIRYAIGSDGMTSSLIGVPSEASTVDRVPMPPMPGVALIQRVTLAAPTVVESVSFNLATYGRHAQHGNLLVELARPAAAAPVFRWSVPVADVLDNRVRSFRLPAASTLQAGDYMLTLRYLGAAPGDLLTVWSFPGQWEGCSSSVDSQPASGCMDFGFGVKRSDLGSFVEVGNQDGIHLLENKNVPAGAYFLSALTGQPNASSSDAVKLTGDVRSGFSLNYSGDSPGYVVTPMSWRSGWHVTRNGVAIRPHRYLGVLPAVPVDGPAELVFRYRPLGLKAGVPAALVSLIALTLVTWRRRRVPLKT